MRSDYAITNSIDFNDSKWSTIQGKTTPITLNIKMSDANIDANTDKPFVIKNYFNKITKKYNSNATILRIFNTHGKPLRIKFDEIKRPEQVYVDGLGAGIVIVQPNTITVKIDNSAKPYPDIYSGSVNTIELVYDQGSDFGYIKSGPTVQLFSHKNL